MLFYLGTHEPSWLGKTDAPLFLSRRRLARRKSLPMATGRWALDSGGFSEISEHGRWTITPEQYVEEARRWRDGIGNLDWAAPMDWMCEPWILEKTGLTVEEHQRRTVDSVLLLRQLAPDVPWVPVLQGWTLADYLRCAAMYQAAGIDLAKEPTVGLGSVCRRQGTVEATEIVFELWQRGIRLHGFGFKTLGLLKCADYLTSSDSLAWSFEARRSAPMEGCKHKSCANCIRWAMRWRARLLEKLENVEPDIFGLTA